MMGAAATPLMQAIGLAELANTARSRPANEPQLTTLLELVQTVCEVTDDDAEVIATVVHMLRSGTVKLCGCLRDQPVESWDA